jgi:hypothetical protein
VLALFPAANQGQAVTAQPVYEVAPTNVNNDNQYVARLDPQLPNSNANHLQLSFFNDRFTEDFPAGPFPQLGDNLYTFLDVSGAVAWTHNFSPTLLNEVQGSYLRTAWNPGPGKDVPSGPNWAQLGSQLPVNSVPGIPQNTPCFGPPFCVPVINRTVAKTNTYEVKDTLHWATGGHTLRFGGQFDRVQWTNDSFAIPQALVGFDGAFTTSPIADFLLGIPDVIVYTGGNGGIIERHWQPGFSLFTQDDWRVKSNLTVTLGLRYEPMIFAREYGGVAVKFQPDVQSVVFHGAPQGLTFPGDPGFQNGRLAATNWNGWQPRVGIAWDPFKDGKTSIHAGAGMYHQQPQDQGYDYVFPPFISFNVVTSATVGRQALIRNGIADPLKGALSPFANEQLTAYSPASQRDAFPWSTFEPIAGFVGYLPGQTPYPTTFQWNLSVQRQITHSSSVQASYVGSRGYHDYTSGIANPIVSHSTVTGQQTYLYQSRGLGNLGALTASGENKYNSLQVTFVQRYSHGLSLNANYTVQKNLGISCPRGLGGIASQICSINPLDPHLDYGITEFDIPQRFVSSFVWDEPWYKSTRGLAGQVLGGWEMVGIYSAQGGTPVTIAGGADKNLTTDLEDRANLVPGQHIHACPGGCTTGLGGYYFNPNAFSPNSPGTAGNSALGILRNPGTWALDMGVFKNFKVVEGQTLQFRSEFFNAFNHPNLSGPDININDPQNFGRLTGKSGVRIIELGLKYNF